MKNLPIIAALLVVILVSCGGEPTRKKWVSLNYMSFEIPDNWTMVKMNCHDSNCGIIITQIGDTIRYDEGLYSNSLTEQSPSLMNYDQIPYLIQNGFDTSNYIFVNDIRKADLDRYRKQNVQFIEKPPFTIKFTYPIKPGTGMTGFYVDSLNVLDLGVIGFSFFGENLDSTSANAFLKIIDSIKFNSKSDKP